MSAVELEEVDADLVHGPEVLERGGRLRLTEGFRWPQSLAFVALVDHRDDVVLHAGPVEELPRLLHRLDDAAVRDVQRGEDHGPLIPGYDDPASVGDDARCVDGEVVPNGSEHLSRVVRVEVMDLAALEDGLPRGDVVFVCVGSLDDPPHGAVLGHVDLQDGADVLRVPVLHLLVVLGLEHGCPAERVGDEVVLALLPDQLEVVLRERLPDPLQAEIVDGVHGLGEGPHEGPVVHDGGEVLDAREEMPGLVASKGQRETL